MSKPPKAPFQVVGYEFIGEHQVPIVKPHGWTETLLGCPQCFTVWDGGGFLTDGYCTGCGWTAMATDFSEALPPEKVEPQRRYLNWNREKYDGQTLDQWLAHYNHEGLGLDLTAQLLSELTGQTLSVANVRSHLRKLEAKT